jgi:1,4-dihydroxy-2-naphthoate octaprenyltransferase
MGPVMVCGAYYVQTLSFSASSLAAAIPIGLLAAGIMHTNDLRDYDTDLIHGKRTLATMLGRRGANSLLAIMDAIAFAVALAAVVLKLLPWQTLLVLLAIPQAVKQVRMVFRDTAASQLHLVWLGGVKLHMQFGLCLIAGLLLGKLI